jgi:hypothetical protein
MNFTQFLQQVYEEEFLKKKDALVNEFMFQISKK